jgi:hypothetical protein
MSTIHKFVFKEPDRAGIEQDACLAIFSAECLHGRPKTRLEVAYLVDADGQRCVFDVRGEAGETAIQVFIGLCGERFGESEFSITPVTTSEQQS